MNALRRVQNGSLLILCAAPCDLLSYLRYPRPLRVLNQAMDGTRSGLSPRAASSTARVVGAHSEPCSVPVMRQP